MARTIIITEEQYKNFIYEESGVAKHLLPLIDYMTDKIYNLIYSCFVKPYIGKFKTKGELIDYLTNAYRNYYTEDSDNPIEIMTAPLVFDEEEIRKCNIFNLKEVDIHFFFTNSSKFGFFLPSETKLDKDNKFNKVVIWLNILLPIARKDLINSTLSHEMLHAYELMSRIMKGGMKSANEFINSDVELDNVEGNEDAKILLKSITYNYSPIERNAVLSTLYTELRNMGANRNNIKDALNKTDANRMYNDMVELAIDVRDNTSGVMDLIYNLRKSSNVLNGIFPPINGSMENIYKYRNKVIDKLSNVYNSFSKKMYRIVGTYLTDVEG